MTKRKKRSPGGILKEYRMTSEGPGTWMMIMATVPSVPVPGRGQGRSSPSPGASTPTRISVVRSSASLKGSGSWAITGQVL